MHHTKRILDCAAISVAIALLSILSGAPSPLNAASLQDELKGLLNSHPRLSAEQDVVKSSDARVDQAFAGFLPTVRLDGDAGHEHIDTPSRVETSDLNRNKITLSATQNLFSGFRTSADHNRAKLRLNASEFRLESVRQRLLFDGISAYYNVLRQSRLIQINRRNEETIKRQLNLEDERVRRGSGMAVDVLLAKTRLQLAAERRVQFEAALHDARANFEQLFGHAPVVSQMPDPKFALRVLPSDVTAAEKSSISGNPALQASRLDVGVAQERRREVRSAFFPEVDLVGQVNREDDVDALRGTRRDWSILLKVSWELFSGLATRSASIAAGYEHAAAQKNLRFAELQVREEVKTAWHRLETDRRRVDLLRNAAVIAAEVFEARQHLRRSGKETAINVLDAQSEVYGAQLNLVAAQFDAQISAFRLLFAMGQLTESSLGL